MLGATLLYARKLERVGYYQEMVGYYQERVGYYQERLGYYQERVGYQQHVAPIYLASDIFL